jgi:hypothetical protein
VKRANKFSCDDMGVHLGPRDLVTVRLASGPGGCAMNLEPIQVVGPSE